MFLEFLMKQRFPVQFNEELMRYEEKKRYLLIVQTWVDVLIRFYNIMS